MENKWFLYTPNSWEFHKFDTQAELEDKAASILESVYLDGDSGWSEDAHHAVAGYGVFPDVCRFSSEIEDQLEAAKIYEVVEEILDRKENYSGEEGDEWPYHDDFDYIARFDIKLIEKETP